MGWVPYFERGCLVLLRLGLVGRRGLIDRSMGGEVVWTRRDAGDLLYSNLAPSTQATDHDPGFVFRSIGRVFDRKGGQDRCGTTTVTRVVLQGHHS